MGPIITTSQGAEIKGTPLRRGRGQQHRLVQLVGTCCSCDLSSPEWVGWEEVLVLLTQLYHPILVCVLCVPACTRTHSCKNIGVRVGAVFYVAALPSFLVKGQQTYGQGSRT